MSELHIKENIIDSLCNILIKRLSKYDSILSVILIGSCARGEETYCLDKTGKKLLYSDIEFFAVVKGKSQIASIKKCVSQLNSEFLLKETSPLFEISVGFLFVDSIRRIDKRFIIFETKKCGRVVYGDDIWLNKLPIITCKNINRSNMVCIINQRLYHVLSEWNKLSSCEKKYCIARNSLDVLTIFLTFSGVLISTYSSRNRFLKEHQELIDGVFDNSFIDRLNDYLAMKLNMSSELYGFYEETEMLQNFCLDMHNLIAFLSAKNGNPFLHDRYRIVRAIAKMRFSDIYFEMKRPVVEFNLEKKMLNFLECNYWTQEDIDNCSLLMSELYKKR